MKTAKSSGLKAYHIFTNQTLDDLIEKRPYTIAELREVRGIGEKKIEAFGEELLKVIRG